MSMSPLYHQFLFAPHFTDEGIATGIAVVEVAAGHADKVKANTCFVFDAGNDLHQGIIRDVADYHEVDALPGDTVLEG